MEMEQKLREACNKVNGTFARSDPQRDPVASCTTGKGNIDLVVREDDFPTIATIEDQEGVRAQLTKPDNITGKESINRIEVKKNDFESGAPSTLSLKGNLDL